jgi:hypothetical protein
MKDWEKGKKLAMENYETWGQWVIECMTDEEIAEDIAEHESFKEWVEIRIIVGEHHQEIMDTAW